MNIYEVLFITGNACELLACITGIVYWKKLRHTYWKWFVVYLGFIFLLEAVGFYIEQVLHQDNILLYYFTIPLEFLFFFWFFGKYFTTRKQKRWPFVAAAIYILSFLVDMLWLQQKKFAFSSFSYCMGNILLLVLIIQFFLIFSNSNAILRYKKNGMFWVCLGLLIFYIGSFPFYGLLNTLRYSYPNVFNGYWIVQISLMHLMYLFFAISFIWGKPR